VTETAARIDRVAVSSPELGAGHVSLGDEVSQDPLGGPFRDPNLLGVFVGVMAANVVFRLLVSSNGRSPYWSLPLATTFGPIGSLVSLLVSTWVVCELSRRRRRKSRQSESIPRPIG
jgi:hypothetical protein